MPSLRQYDRMPSFFGGMDSYHDPTELQPNQGQLLQNFMVMDTGRAVTRPGADQIDSVPTSFNKINPVGPVQGLYFLDNFTNGQFILLGEGANLYKWNGVTWSDPLSFTLTTSTAPFAAVQGVDKLLISDGVKQMQLWDGMNFVACGASADTNAPLGATMLSFIAGSFVAAGPAMSAGTVPKTYPPDTLFFSDYLDATAGHWDVTAQSVRIGNGDGEAITGIIPIQNTAGVTPIYNLAVFKENSIWILGINPSASGGPFAGWTTAPQGDIVGTGIGLVGSRAMCVYQNDVLFMSQDGVQSLQRMQAAAGQYQLTQPLSLPIQSYIDRINWDAAENIVAVKYKQLAMFFVPLDGSATNNYALVWNGRFGQWMIWTGWILQSALVTRFSKKVQLVLGDFDGSVNLWKDATTLAGEDSTYLDNGAAIANQEIDTRAMIFGNLDLQKKLKAVQVRFNAGNAAVSLNATCDLADSDDWNTDVTPNAPTLPVQLPFVLGNDQPAVVYRSLEGLPYCNQVTFKITLASGWCDVKNLTAVAYLKPMKDNQA